jgi:predicted RNase H-like nuclease (RuvC/YqgF family)
MEENMTTQEEVGLLREENEHLSQAIRRYRAIVENFEDEYAAVSKYVEKKAKFNKETKVVYLDKSRVG